MQLFTILCCRLDRRSLYLLWYTNDTDGVVTDKQGRIVIRSDAEELLRYAATAGISAEPGEPYLYDLDLIAQWIHTGDIGLIDCNQFNSAWNLFSDISTSINGGFDPDRKLTNDLYNKLFWGCNLPAVTPEGERYHPSWSEDEIQLLSWIFQQGVTMFRDEIACAS